MKGVSRGGELRAVLYLNNTKTVGSDLNLL